MNLVFNNAPLVHSKPTADSTWETSEVSKFTLTRGLTLKPYKADSFNGQSLVGGFKLSGTTEMQTNASNLYSVSNDTKAEVFSQGLFQYQGTPPYNSFHFKFCCSSPCCS